LAWHLSHPQPLEAGLQTQLDVLAGLSSKLNQGLIQIAAFGLVSRGKSAVLNALLGEKVFLTGPLNGVTQWPRSVRWSPVAGSVASSELPGSLVDKVQIELIDTPGLDEVQGEARTQMAKEIARQADLILFVTAGELTRTELAALAELREAQKPLILVFNKQDLYPNLDRETLYQTFQDQQLQQLLSLDELVMVAAAPAPRQIRVEWPDGRITFDWEAPSPQIQPLKQKLLQLLNREGRFLLALNTLFQAKAAEVVITQKVLASQESQAQELIWRFVQAKALAVALNPLALLDLLGGMLSDLMLIRALAKLYGLPMTRYEAGKLWRTILSSSGGLLLSQLGSGFALGLGKSTVFFTEGIGGISTFLGAAIAQAGMAGYGAFIVGQASQAYLEKGCTWGALGSSTLIQEILNSLESDMILYRIRQELQEKLAAL
jgi:hypothetical protein